MRTERIIDALRDMARFRVTVGVGTPQANADHQLLLDAAYRLEELLAVVSDVCTELAGRAA